MTTNVPQNRDNQETEIDLLEIINLLWRKIWLIIIGFVVGAVLAFSLTKFLVTPQYEAQSIIYIFSKTTSITSLADLQMGSQLTEDFTIIATTRDVVESVISELNLNYSYEELVKNITVKNPSSSHMLEIHVKDTDPVRAANICNNLSDQLREQIADIMNTDKPSVVQRAIAPKSQASPNVVRNTEIGALVGAVLVAAVLVVRHLLDDTIKTEDDVQKYLGADVLAAFPYIRSIDSKKKKADAKSTKAVTTADRSGARALPDSGRERTAVKESRPAAREKTTAEGRKPSDSGRSAERQLQLEERDEE